MVSWPSGVGRIVLDTIDSTNDEGRRMAKELDQPTWIMARRQTQGRGRRNRCWWMADGNFAASLVVHLPDKNDHKMASWRTFSAALALRDTCAELTASECPFTLKWPNDLLLNQGKVAGILLECTEQHFGLVLIVGFGVNLVHSPPESTHEKNDGGQRNRAVNLRCETGVTIRPEEFLTRLATKFQKREGQLQKEGFPAIRADWLRRASGIGETVKMVTENEMIYGVFEGIDEEGHAIVSTRDGRVRLPAGEMQIGFRGHVDVTDH